MSRPLLEIVDKENEARLRQTLELSQQPAPPRIPPFENLSADPETEQSLHGSDNGGTSASMDQELVDAKIAAAEARTETKFAELIGRTDAKFAEVLGRLDRLTGEVQDMRSDNRHTRSTVRNAAFALAALIIGVPALLAAVVPAAVNWGADHAAVVPLTPAIEATPSPALPKAGTANSSSSAIR